MIDRTAIIRLKELHNDDLPEIGGCQVSTLRHPISVGLTSWRCVEPGRLSVVRPEDWEGARLNIELPNCQGRGRMTEVMGNAVCIEGNAVCIDVCQHRQ